MSLHTLSEWLRCPNCFQPLSPREPLVLSCPIGHAFDANKRGYVSLIGGSRRLRADSAAMLDARERFLDAGWFRPLRDEVATLVEENGAARLIDAGCGNGYYLAGALARLPDASALAMDLSPAAVSRAIRSAPNVDGLVADTWSPLPIRDEAADTLLNVFAPRNAAEFHRVLRPGGLLIVVIPQTAHLIELREQGLLLDVQAGKRTQLTDSMSAHFVLESRWESTDTMRLTSRDVELIVGMGPSAHHTVTGRPPRAGLYPVTASFEVFGFRKPR